MKKGNLTGLVLTAALVAAGAACGNSASNSAMNHSGMNHNSMNHNSMNHNSMPMNSNSQMNHNSMDHSAMMKSDPNAATAPYDLQFIDTMAHHHEGAIQMAEMAVKRSQNEEVKKFAQKIIDDQKKENAQLKEWREKWFAGAAPAKNMEMPGMKDSMSKMNPDHMKMMEAMTGKDFDLHFVEMMIPHHEGAIVMAKEAQQKSERPEVKTLAAQIIKAQEAEIKQMNDWKAAWKK